MKARTKTDKKIDKRVDFRDQIKRNNRGSFFLFLLAVGLATLLIWLIGFAFGVDVFFMLIIAIVISLTTSYISYINSDKIAIASAHAFPATDNKYRHLNNMVEGLAIGAGIPKPRVYIMPSPEINAFATGRNPEKSVVCVTEGALKHLNDSELEAVLAHELSHIKHYDIRYVTIATVVVGMISIFSEIFLRSLWFRRRGDDQGGFLIMILAIILAILAPIVVRIVYFAISRKREFMADAGSVEITRSPTGLISALKKIDDFYASNKKTMIGKTAAPMYIQDPYKIIKKAFSTHPTTEERIKALERM